jgi:hypothetical protein
MGKMKELDIMMGDPREAIYAAEDAFYEALKAKPNLTPLERAEITVWKQGRNLRGAHKGLGGGAGSYETQAQKELLSRPAMVAVKKT